MAIKTFKTQERTLKIFSMLFLFSRRNNRGIFRFRSL